MNLTALRNLVTSNSARQVLKLQKHAPVILFVGGTVGVVATVILACRATLKLEEVLDDGHQALDEIAIEAETTHTEIRKTALAKAYVKNAGNVVKLYAPAVVVGGLSIGALTGSHVILKNRNTALMAAYAAVDKAYRLYRERVLKELGPEKDAQFRHGLIEKEYVEETETGPVVLRALGTPTDEPSMYARFFDEGCSPWRKEPWANQNFIKCQEQYANDKLHAVGHVFLNEIYDSLGIKRCPEGQIIGWVLNNGDNHIDFGIYRNIEAGTAFVNGAEKSVLLDFNVDGVIWDKI